MSLARRGETARRAPGAGGRIVKLRAGDKPGAALPPRDEYLAIGQQRGGVKLTRSGEAAGGAPHAGGRIVKLRAGKIDAVKSPRDEQLAVGQQRSGVRIARGGERAGVDKRIGPSRRGRKQGNHRAPRDCQHREEGRLADGEEGEPGVGFHSLPFLISVRWL